MSERADAAFPAGTRVRYRAGLVNLRGWDGGTGEIGVVEPGGAAFGPRYVLVRWGGRPNRYWEEAVSLEAAAPEAPA